MTILLSDVFLFHPTKNVIQQFRGAFEIFPSVLSHLESHLDKDMQELILLLLATSHLYVC